MPPTSTLMTETLQFPFTLTRGPALAQVHFDDSGTLRAGAAALDADLTDPRDWAALTVAVFGGILTVLPDADLFEAYAVHHARKADTHLLHFAPVTGATPFITSLPRATFHLTGADLGWNVRCAVRHPGTLDVAAVISLDLDEAGGTLNLSID